jgi:hypothetical protein
MQVEFLENCLIQIEGLKERVGPGFAQEQKAIWPEAWNHDEQADDLLRKIALAESFALEIGGVVRDARATISTTWSALETLQDVIDNCERSLQCIMGSLHARQLSYPNEIRH